jgi:hypothetical protein
MKVLNIHVIKQNNRFLLNMQLCCLVLKVECSVCVSESARCLWFMRVYPKVSGLSR